MILSYVSIKKVKLNITIVIISVFNKDLVEKILTKLLYWPHTNEIKVNDEDRIERKNKSSQKFIEVWISLKKAKEKKTAKKSKVACNRVFVSLGRFTKIWVNL